jgi:hypothetical protein
LFQDYDSVYPGYPTKLQDAAVKAWGFLDGHPTMTPASGSDGAQNMASAAGNSDPQDDKRRRVFASAELFKTTGGTNYHTYFKNNYNDKPGTNDNGLNPVVDQHFDASLAWDLNRAYIIYATTTDAEATIISAIKSALKNTIDQTIAANYLSGADAYRGFEYEGHYCWGSNMLRCNWAKLALFAAYLNIAPSQNPLYKEIAEEYMHFLHGRNALSYVYLSNMGEKGANLGGQKSVMQIYHGWFCDGSPLYDGSASQYGPAPGYLAGGPNKFFPKSWISPPYGEPAAKSFKDWNTAWNAAHNDNENSWEITEPAIYYQAAYVLVLSQFVPSLVPPASRNLVNVTYRTRVEQGLSGTAQRAERGR